MGRRRRMPSDMERRAAYAAATGGEVFVAGVGVIKPPKDLQVWETRDTGERWLTFPVRDPGVWSALADEDWRQIYDFVGRPDIFRLRLGRQGARWVITGLHMATSDGSPLPIRGLRQIPFASIVAAFERNADIIGEPPPAPDARPGRRGHGEDFYRGITDAYALALKEAPERPIQWLAKQYDKAPSTIHRWLERAKQLEEGER